MTTTSPLDSENIALANELHTLAERFIIEASMWLEPSAQAELQRSAHLLAEIARGIARNAVEPPTAQAYVEAGETIIMQIQGARRFFIAINTLPSVVKRNVAP